MGPGGAASCLMFHALFLLLFSMLVYVCVCVCVCVCACRLVTYFASICEAWKPETPGGPLRKYTAARRTKTHAYRLGRGAEGCPRPHAHPLTLDRWTRLPPPPFSLLLWDL